MASSINGVGTTYYGERDYWPDSSYITTEWVIFLLVPLFPIRSFRLRYVVSTGSAGMGGVENQYVVYEKTRPNLKQVAGTYLLILSAVLIAYWGFKELSLLGRVFGIGEAGAAFLPIPLAILPFVAVHFLRRRARKRAGLVSVQEHEKREAKRIRAAIGATGHSICPGYRLSGRVGHAFWVVPPAAALVALILAGIYSWIDLHWRSLQIVAIFQTLIFSALVAGATGALVRFAKCRNAFVASLLGIAAGTFAVYVAWVWFEFCSLQGSNATGTNGAQLWKELFSNPRAVYAVAAKVNEHGTFSASQGSSDKSRPMDGLELSLVWIGEAAIVIGMGAWIPAMCIRHRLFCERCNQWATPWKQPIFFQPTEKQEAEGRVAHGDLSGLGGLSRTHATTNPRLRLSIQQCPRCAEIATYSLDWLWDVQARSGVETKIKSLTKPRVLPAEYASALQMERK